MKRLLAFLYFLILSSVASTQVAAQTAPIGAIPSPGSAKERVVIQVSTPDQRMWAQSLNYAENLRDLYGKDNVEIEIVALGQGIGVLKLDSPMATRVADTLKSGVKVVACQVTMRRQKLQKEDMLSDIGYVPAGLGEVIKRQREGWAYIGG